MPDLPRRFNARKAPQKRVGGSSHLRDHSRAYRALRDAVLDAEPLCRYCRHDGRVTLAQVVDHALALSLGGDNKRGNLVPACRACNDAKAKDERRFLTRGFDAQDSTLR